MISNSLYLCIRSIDNIPEQHLKITGGRTKWDVDSSSSDTIEAAKKEGANQRNFSGIGSAELIESSKQILIGVMPLMTCRCP